MGRPQVADIAAQERLGTAAVAAEGIVGTVAAAVAGRRLPPLSLESMHRNPLQKACSNDKSIRSSVLSLSAVLLFDE